MYTVQLDSGALRRRAHVALVRALETSPWTAKFGGERAHRMSCGPVRVGLDGDVKRLGYLGGREAATTRKAVRVMLRGKKLCITLDNIRRRRRAPLGSMLPPEVEDMQRRVSRRKNGIHLDWQGWLAFSALVNRTLDASVGAVGDVWSIPHFVRKLVIRQDGRAAVDYDARVTYGSNRYGGMLLRIDPVFA